MTGLNINQLHPFAVGFDRVFDRLVEFPQVHQSQGFPPYNIRTTKGEQFFIDLALAGLDINDVEIEVKEDGSVKNLTGYSARAQARSAEEDSNAAFSFTCSIPTPTNGKVLMNLPAATSSSATAGQYVYDLEIYTSSDAAVSRLIKGTCTLDREITRA